MPAATIPISFLSVAFILKPVWNNMQVHGLYARRTSRVLLDNPLEPYSTAGPAPAFLFSY